mgnify:CR=1 FL=1
MKVNLSVLGASIKFLNCEYIAADCLSPTVVLVEFPMTLFTPYNLLGSAFTVIGRFKVAPVSAPITVTLVEVCEVIDLEITFTD